MNYVGIDVSKAHLDVSIRPIGSQWRASNTEAGIGQVVSQLKDASPQLVVMEATGGIEAPLSAALLAASLPVVVVNPRQIRDFAKATGRLAKTYTLDAEVIAHFAEAVRPEVRPLPDSQGRHQTLKLHLADET